MLLSDVYEATCTSGFSLTRVYETLLSDILILVICILSPAPPTHRHPLLLLLFLSSIDRKAT